MKDAVVEDARPQPAAALEPFGGDGAERRVHPMAGPAFLGGRKADALHGKLGAHQRVQVHAAGWT